VCPGNNLMMINKSKMPIGSQKYLRQLETLVAIFFNNQSLQKYQHVASTTQGTFRPITMKFWRARLEKKSKIAQPIRGSIGNTGWLIDSNSSSVSFHDMLNVIFPTVTYIGRPKSKNISRSKSKNISRPKSKKESTVFYDFSMMHTNILHTNWYNVKLILYE
jgi:hypothetical protein